jgi:DNA-binding NarL/FixJ family response regulator
MGRLRFRVSRTRSTGSVPAQSFEVVQSEGTRRIDDEITRHKPAALCFEFDYPDRERLLAMQSVKRSHPRLPILMLTLGHSESLAVWAFRARVWNYLVQAGAGHRAVRNAPDACLHLPPDFAAACGPNTWPWGRPMASKIARSAQKLRGFSQAWIT